MRPNLYWYRVHNANGEWSQPSIVSIESSYRTALARIHAAMPSTAVIYTTVLPIPHQCTTCGMRWPAIRFWTDGMSVTFRHDLCRASWTIYLQTDHPSLVMIGKGDMAMPM